ncbi:hypothetical protein [Amycolatopsis anabasis]|uniref:hypothetical protein n=1 Tax=Amycolatopsis anabasis TaxID=1840409 RepID=UPI0015D28C9F|nr:hypothetical protein [Amycolatopsis anabasis]
MTVAAEPETLGELIADCALIPQSLRAEAPVLPPPAVRPWTVDEACHAQVADLDEYV